MEYKTLILVDNSENLTTLNKDIIKQTIKHMLEKSPNEMKISIAQIGSDGYIKYLADFDDTSQTKINSVDNISFLTPPVSVMDIVADVILEWKNHDFANRDIVVFSAADVNNMSVYTLEELILELEELNYPVYTVGCVQNDNVSKLKTMASLSRVSDGIIVYTDEGRDADVEKQISDKIFKAMSEKRTREDSNLNKSIDVSQKLDSSDAVIDNSIATENGLSSSVGDNSNIIYDTNKTGYEYSSFILAGIILFATFFAVMFIYAILRKERQKSIQRNYYSNTDEIIRKHDEKINASAAFNVYDENDTQTRCLTIYDNIDDIENDEEDSGTRLLYQSREGLDITLEDRADPTKYFRANVKDRIIIGRSKKLCDIPVSYDDSVSGKHCELFLRGNSLYVRDLSSSNGTMVNQQKVYQDIQINNGDVLRLGQLSFLVTVRSNMGGFVSEF